MAPQTQVSREFPKRELPVVAAPQQDNNVSEENKRNRQFKELDRVIQDYSKEPGQLIGILQKAQNIFGYLPEDVQAYIAEKVEMPVSEVNGVVTFYSLFSTEPKGKVMLNVCMGTACYVKGAQEIMDAIKDTLKIDAGETTPDNQFTVKSTRCIGACGLAPILEANGQVHGRIGADDIAKIIQE